MAKAKRRTHGGFPQDTEILTDGGWKKVYSLSLADKVYVYEQGSGWITKNQIRKNVIPSATWAWGIVTERGEIVVGEGESLPTTSGSRTVGAKWPSLGVYTALADRPQLRMNQSAIITLMAVLRYGIIDDTGYSVRVRDAEQRRLIRMSLGRDGSVCKDGWEKWSSVISTPRLRGFDIDLSGLCPTNATTVLNAYKAFIGDATITKQQSHELQKYFTLSGIACDVVTTSPSKYRLSFHESNIAKVLSTTRRKVSRLLRLTGADGKVVVRQQGVPFVVGIWQS